MQRDFSLRSCSLKVERFNKNNCRAYAHIIFIYFPLFKRVWHVGIIPCGRLRALCFCFLMKRNFQRLKKTKPCCLRNKALYLAEKEGFEPPVPHEQDNWFRVSPVRPLRHFSGKIFKNTKFSCNRLLPDVVIPERGITPFGRDPWKRDYSLLS